MAVVFNFVSELYGSPKQGGENIAMWQLASQLKSEGKDVSFYSYSKADKVINTVFSYRLLSLPFFRDIFFAPFIGRKLLKQLDKPGVVSVISTPSLASMYSPKQLVIICHAIRSQKAERLSSGKHKILFNPAVIWVIKFLEGKSFKRAKAIVVLNEDQRKYLQKQFRIEARNIHLIPNGIDTEFFDGTPKDTLTRQVLFVGRLTYQKGFDLVLDSVEQFSESLHVVTQKVDPALFKRAEKNKKITITIRPTREEIKRIYAGSDVFILPSRDEEQPLTVLEAMSSGLPVVVSKIAASNVVIDKENGIVLKFLNAQELAKAVNHILSSSDLKNIGQRNRKKAIEDYSLDKVAKEVASLATKISA